MTSNGIVMDGEKGIDEMLAEHIQRKLEEKGEILDSFDVARDSQIKYIMFATI